MNAFPLMINDQIDERILERLNIWCQLWFNNSKSRFLFPFIQYKKNTELIFQIQQTQMEINVSIFSGFWLIYT